MREELRAAHLAEHWVFTDLHCPSCIEAGLGLCNDEGDFNKYTSNLWFKIVKACELCMGTCKMPIPYVELTGQIHPWPT